MVRTQYVCVLYVCAKFQADISIHSKVIRGGRKISKLGHVTLSYAPFEPWTLNLWRIPSTHTYCQILFLYLDLLLSYGWKQCEYAILKAKLAMRMRGVTWPRCRVHLKPRIWNQRPQFAYSLYNFYGATTTIKGSLHVSTSIVKQFSVGNFQSRQNLAQKRRSFGNYGV